PGFDLARAAQEAGHAVTAAPGASAAVTALTLSGLPAERFFFAGFLPNARGQRASALSELAAIPATLIFYESPRRLAAMLAAAAEALGPERPAAVCRELTKRFEEVRRGSLAELAAQYESAAPKGEIVVLIGRGRSEDVSEDVLESALRAALAEMSVRDAADHVSRSFGVARRPVYQMAMRVRDDAEG
ncbi:16S rRNA (cytidine(1402)-2'-O)-methyltransferase, partial [Roseivivax sp. CAU 1761]